ncbi:hypothetical protein RHSIM_RhsimUnG0114900 [Rhododendron simsii]|uniref:Uncharacterized protein n=1 Tax=Rhododendron simsii TaxID=118357 RepID=A0A834FW29_RHOSS|nr:hypothetical protein RHSIM_RhsimUnG0114900 [Rhododendron simsii]
MARISIHVCWILAMCLCWAAVAEAEERVDGGGSASGKHVGRDMDRDGKQFPERDSELVKKIGAATALEVRATGVRDLSSRIGRALVAVELYGNGGTEAVVYMVAVSLAIVFLLEP